MSLKYFQSWLNNDVEIADFLKTLLYSSAMDEYHGLSQIVTWFENWNNKGQKYWNGQSNDIRAKPNVNC